jgi:glycosidase
MAEIVPIEFWSWVIPQVKEQHPNIIFIAEIYKVSLYQAFVLKGKFDFLYDKVDLYDTVRAVMEGKTSANAITNCWQVLEGLDRHMLRFLENHDEQRIASRQFANDPFMGIPGMAVAALMNRGPVMIYFGQEVGEPASENEGFSGADGRTSIFDYCTVPEHQKWMSGGAFDGKLLSLSQKKLRMAYKNILNLCLKKEAISKGGFYDLQYLNQNHAQFTPEFHYAFIRHYKNQILLVIANFDRWHGYDMRVKLSPHVFSHIGLNPQKPILGKELLGSEQTFSVHPHDANAYGIPITINAKRAMVFELTQ